MTLAPASRWGLSCAESACVTDLKGRSSRVAQDGPTPNHHPNSGPAGATISAGLSCAGHGLGGSHCGAAAFEVLSCGRDRVRWPCRWLLPWPTQASGRAGRAVSGLCAAGSLVLRRMDRRGTKRGLVRAKKHGTKSGTGAPLRRGFFYSLLTAQQRPLGHNSWYSGSVLSCHGRSPSCSRTSASSGLISLSQVAANSSSLSGPTCSVQCGCSNRLEISFLRGLPSISCRRSVYHCHAKRSAAWTAAESFFWTKLWDE